MNTLKIHDIRRVGTNRFEYNYTVDGDWKKYFDLSQPMWAEYNTGVEDVPDSVAVLPLVGNFIVLASLMDADIYVDEIDREFYEAVPQFLRGFDEVMPDHVHFKLEKIIHAQHIVDNPATDGPKKSNLLFFSGGVDATYSLVSHIEEKPALVTIWGADIPWDNTESWLRTAKFNEDVASRHHLDFLTIHSNFRRSYHSDNIENYSYELVKNWWWPAFHHGLSMMCLAAPLAHKNRSFLYMGSSFSRRDIENWGTLPTASAPEIDNHVSFCGCSVVHDGFEASRYEKVLRICQHYKDQESKPFLRVCYHSIDGYNCGVCEKCVRTIFTLLLLDANPEDYGFTYSKSELPTALVSSLQEMARTERIAFMAFYADIQTALRKKYSADQVPAVLKTFYEQDIESLADFLQVPNNEYIASQRNGQKIQQELYNQIGQLNYQLSVARQEAQAARDALLAIPEPVNNDWAVEELNKIRNSTSWKITKPLRWTMNSLRKVKRFLWKLARIAKAFIKQDDYWKAIVAKLRDMAFHKGAKVINRIYPPESWRNNYARWRWWFITSDQYKTLVKPQFDKMLQEYESKLWNRGFLIQFDYWLCWIFFGAEPDDYFNYEYFRKGWAWRNHHVTKQRLNFIDPVFNKQDNVHLIRNKASFYKNWNTYLKRNWCIPQETSFEEFVALFGSTPRLMIKPISSYGGKGIYTLDLNADNMESVYQQLHNEESPIIAEQFVNQTGYLHDIYPNALNPLRVTTIRAGSNIEVCYGFFTTGCNGNFISNDCSGGICFSVDTATGRLGVGQGRTSSGYRAHPDTGVEVYGNYVPDWDKIKEFACEAHRLAPEGIGMIGWDICWNNGELSLIEGNGTPGFAELPDRRENQWKKVQGYLDIVDSIKNNV